MHHFSYRILASVLAVFLFSAGAKSANLISADVVISSSGAPGYTAYNAPGLLAGASHAETGCSGLCLYDFSLATTGFSFSQHCATLTPSDGPIRCEPAAITVTLTNMVFTGGEILTNASLVQSLVPIADGGPSSIVFGPHSATLNIPAFDMDCGGSVSQTVTFQTGPDTSESSIPEPPAMALVGMSLVGLIWWRRRQA